MCEEIVFSKKNKFKDLEVKESVLLIELKVSVVGWRK